ncbi:demethylmenaquinone methyltransferase [Aplysia californica]|uniref:Demethylmenaquinone methyltransferase n=1 Tax=Aplysia californica TaxID=6500 RepID=A0ABM1VQU0_APLCA|nr:demethylmenaquinone methyltransferase [Aplysia californica]
MTLHEKGFRHIDGVDPSQGMLDVARTKGVYNNLICSYVGVEGSRLPFEDDTYDAVTLCGGMGQNMMPCAGVYEMIRVVKPGGYVVNLFREEILLSVEEYMDRLEPLMESLETQGKWKRLSRERYPEYQVDRVGIINVHQVC